MTPISPERLRNRRKALTKRQFDIAMFEQEMKRLAEDAALEAAWKKYADKKYEAKKDSAKQFWWRMK